MVFRPNNLLALSPLSLFTLSETAGALFDAEARKLVLAIAAANIIVDVDQQQSQLCGQSNSHREDNTEKRTQKRGSFRIVCVHFSSVQWQFTSLERVQAAPSLLLTRCRGSQYRHRQRETVSSHPTLSASQPTCCVCVGVCSPSVAQSSTAATTHFSLSEFN